MILTNLISFKLQKETIHARQSAYWTNQPFADPYGRGWILSCVEPIYYRDQFIGILSGDIRLHSMKNKYFSSSTEITLIIDNEGGNNLLYQRSF